MSYKITAYRANGTSRDWADVLDEDAARLLAFWERGLRLPAVRVNLGQQQTRSVLINRDAFEAIEVEATPLQFFAPITAGTGDISGTLGTPTLPYLQVESSLGCGVIASTAGGPLAEPQEE